MDANWSVLSLFKEPQRRRNDRKLIHSSSCTCSGRQAILNSVTVPQSCPTIFNEMRQRGRKLEYHFIVFTTTQLSLALFLPASISHNLKKQVYGTIHVRGINESLVETFNVSSKYLSYFLSYLARQLFSQVILPKLHFFKK